jgi:cytochrome P450
LIRHLCEAPGPRAIGGDPLSLLLYYRSFRRDPLTWIGDRLDRYGDTYFARYGRFGTAVSRDPQVIADVLVNNAGAFRRCEGIATFRLFKRHLGEGLLTSDGALWKHQRRIINPAFMSVQIESYGPSMVDFTSELLEAWGCHETRDVHRDLIGLTFRIAVQCLFGHDTGMDGDALSETLGEFRKTIPHPANSLPSWVPHPARRYVRRAVSKADEITYSLIAARRANRDHPNGDLLGRLVRAMDASGHESSMPLRRARDEMVTLLIAGHETTSNTCAWALYLLAKHPEHQVRAQEELDAVLRGGRPTVKHLGSLPYLDMIVRETMRMYPAVYAVGRDVDSDTNVAGYQVPKGNSVLLWIYHAHQDERWFPNPQRFDPERFTPARHRHVPQGAYAPFGLGARACIGGRFASQEARLILATMLSRYSFSVSEGYRVERSLAATMAPKGGLPLVIRRRSATRAAEALPPQQ